MRRSVLALSVIIIVLLAAGIYYYATLVSASHYTNGNISFDYPKNYVLDQNPLGSENSAGYFVVAIHSPSNSSAIVIFQIPLNSTKNVTNVTQNITPSNSSSNNTNTSNSSSGNTVITTNKTVLVTTDNLQAYLDQLKIRGGNPQQMVKNGYTYYTSGGLRYTFVNYNSTSRIISTVNIVINDTAIVKNGTPNFYVIEYISGDNSADSNNAYMQIVNSFRIM